MKFIISLMALASFVNVNAQGYDIQFSSNVNYGMAYLTYYNGKNLNVQDSASINKKGQVNFKSSTKLAGGIYSLIFGDKKFSSDFLLDKEQQLVIKADTNNLGKTDISGSIDNDIFEAYQNYLAEKAGQLKAVKDAYTTATDPAEKAKYEKKYNELNVEINDYRNNIIKTKPNSFMSALLQAMKDPIYPPHPAVTAADTLANYQFYKQHYWDGFSLTDDRLLHTPFFLPRLETYYRDLVSPQSDSTIKDIDYRLVMARQAPEVYKYLLNWFTDEYINPKYMGQDAVFVHLFEKYHSQGLSPWLNEKQMKTITNRAYMLMSNLIGEQAENITMLSPQNDTVSLYNVKAPYTLLVFWDPSCGHCKLELPKIDSIYRASWEAKGLKIFAVLTEKTESLWMPYIKDHHIEDWIHVHQDAAMLEAEKSSPRPGYRQSFDVTITPTLLLLDADKRIIAKKLNYLQLDALINSKSKKEQ